MEEIYKSIESIKQGNSPLYEAFKLGFMACIESVEDKSLQNESFIKLAN